MKRPWTIGRRVAAIFIALLVPAVAWAAAARLPEDRTAAVPSATAMAQRPRRAPVRSPTPTPGPTPFPATPVPTAAPTPVPTPNVPPEAPPPALPPPTPPPASPAPARGGAQASGLALDVEVLINQQRASRGLPALAANPALTAAAQRYAALHFAQPDPFQLNHNLDGTALDRAQAEGYSGGVGEVLVISEPSASEMVNLWLNSPPHNAIIMGAGFSEMGVGCAQGPYTSPDGSVWQLALCAGEVGIP